MVEEIEITLPYLTAKQKAFVMGAVYRQSLVEVGHSADFHVYDLARNIATYYLRQSKIKIFSNLYAKKLLVLIPLLILAKIRMYPLCHSNFYFLHCRIYRIQF